MSPRTPIEAAFAFAAGNAEALRDIPLRNTDGRTDLADMDGLPLVPSHAWGGHHHQAWEIAGLIRFDVEASRFRLSEAGRRAVEAARAKKGGAAGKGSAA